MQNAVSSATCWQDWNGIRCLPTCTESKVLGQYTLILKKVGFWKKKKKQLTKPYKDSLLLVYSFCIYSNVLKRFCTVNMSQFHKTWDGIRVLEVLYVFYELSLLNKFEVAMRIIGIQSKMNVNFVFSVKLCFRNLQIIFLNSKVCFLHQIEEIWYLDLHKHEERIFVYIFFIFLFFFFFFSFVKHALERTLA